MEPTLQEMVQAQQADNATLQHILTIRLPLEQVLKRPHIQLELIEGFGVCLVHSIHD